MSFGHMINYPMVTDKLLIMNKNKKENEQIKTANEGILFYRS